VPRQALKARMAIGSLHFLVALPGTTKHFSLHIQTIEVSVKAEMLKLIKKFQYVLI
jgi:hypothetical protein